MPMKRCAIYFFYDSYGVADDYVDTMLSALDPLVERLVVVCNGQLSEACRRLFGRHTSEILVRENKGFDVWAYKAALNHIGWEALARYDELILMNFTLFGPLYPLEEMFSAMEARPELDFWGSTKCKEFHIEEDQKRWQCPYGYTPEHIQSSFLVCRKRLAASQDFRTYWQNVPPILSYYDAGGKHEQVFTKHFADLGYRWDVYTDIDDLDPMEVGYCPTLSFPKPLVSQKRSPFLKRRSFFQGVDETYLFFPLARELLRFVAENTCYDPRLILQNVLRACNQYDLAETLYPVELVRDDAGTSEPGRAVGAPPLRRRRVAVWVRRDRFFDQSDIDWNLSRLQGCADVFFGSDAGQSAENVFTGAGARLADYDYVFVLNWIPREPDGGSTMNLQLQCAAVRAYLQSPARIEALCALLDGHPDWGSLTAADNALRSAQMAAWNEWRGLYPNAVQWRDANKLQLALAEGKPPVYSTNGCAVYRSAALRGLDKLQFDRTDPLTLSYLLPLVVQSNGFMPVRFASHQDAQLLIAGLQGYAKYMPAQAEEWHRITYVRTLEQQLAGMEQQLEEAHGYAAGLEQQLAEARQYIARLETDIAAKTGSEQRLEEALRSQQAELDRRGEIIHKYLRWIKL